MTFDQMTMDQATDAAIRISSALSIALEDKEVKNFIDDVSKAGNDVEIMDWIPQFLPRLVTLLFRRQKEALYEIIGALSQADAEAVGKMTFGDGIRIIMENWGAIRGFFTH